jgi:hypothetical protein
LPGTKAICKEVQHQRKTSSDPPTEKSWSLTLVVMFLSFCAHIRAVFNYGARRMQMYSYPSIKARFGYILMASRLQSKRSFWICCKAKSFTSPSMMKIIHMAPNNSLDFFLFLSNEVRVINNCDEFQRQGDIATESTMGNRRS